MGPRSLKRGNSTSPSPARSSARCFNGTTLSQAWKCQCRQKQHGAREVLQWDHALSSVEIHGIGKRYSLDSVLQWDHALSSVEMIMNILNFPHRRKASMGPRSLKRGNMIGRCCEHEVVTTLQWDHALSSVEISLAATEPGL